MARKTISQNLGTVHPKIQHAYVASGIWKCPEAPIDPAVALQVKEQSGAHYWVGLPEGTDFYCKYCLAIKVFKA